MKQLIFILLTTLTISSQAQQNLLLDTIRYEEGAIVQSVELFSDSNSTSFVIFVTDYVSAHYHEYHTETILVLEGKAEMQLDDQTFKIQAGSFLTIPPQSIHSVKVTSEMPLKVLSVQSPEFLGKDRHFVKE